MTWSLPSALNTPVLRHTLSHTSKIIKGKMQVICVSGGGGGGGRRSRMRWPKEKEKNIQTWKERWKEKSQKERPLLTLMQTHGVCSVRWHTFSVTHQEAFRCGWPDCKTTLLPHQNNSKWHNHVCSNSKTSGEWHLLIVFIAHLLGWYRMAKDRILFSMPNYTNIVKEVWQKKFVTQVFTGSLFTKCFHYLRHGSLHPSEFYLKFYVV